MPLLLILIIIVIILQIGAQCKWRSGKNGTVYDIRLCANARTSRAVLKTEKLARTVPEESVPADSCANGAQ